ncbi:MAG: hypothetical protein LBL65_04415 [Campylobacteraceae bacterium]|nr:hypothetical protein [Campylobacteraceae bacterium]
MIRLSTEDIYHTNGTFDSVGITENTEIEQSLYLITQYLKFGVLRMMNS